MADQVGMNRPQAGMIPAFKGQPWCVFDTVASPDFTVGTTTFALGSNQSPAINGQGEMIFFSAGRTKATVPQLTNMDQSSQLAYGFKCYAIGIEFKFPTFTTIQALDPTFVASTTTTPATAGSVGALGAVAPTVKLLEAILNWSVFSLTLGQEEQTDWPLSSFGSGGGLWQSAYSVANGQNGFPDIGAILKLPEPVEMGRTQVLSAKIKISPQMFSLIGQPGALGVGQPLGPYTLAVSQSGATPPVATVVQRTQPPYSVQVKLLGERIKDTQYGAANAA